MEYILRQENVPSLLDAVEILGCFSALINFKPSPDRLELYAINNSLSSYAQVVIASNFFTQVKAVDVRSFDQGTACKISASVSFKTS